MKMIWYFWKKGKEEIFLWAWARVERDWYETIKREMTKKEVMKYILSPKIRNKIGKLSIEKSTMKELWESTKDIDKEIKSLKSNLQ
jgi:hypothetical protein